MRYLSICFALALPFATGCQREPSAPAPEPAVTAPTPVAAATALKIVDPQYVCMVNNTVFPNPQIPVPVGDQTYYGCCENGKKTLAKDPRARYAVDPVTAAVVDKAAATILAMPDGSVRYFASRENAQKFGDGSP